MSKYGHMVTFIAVMLFFSMPIFAAGNLTVSRSSLLTPAYINTGSNALMNITLNATVGNVSITGIVINLTGSSTVSNFSTFLIYNDSDNNGAVGVSEALLGSNATFNATTNSTVVNLSISVPANTERHLLLVLNVSSLATLRTNVSINITSNTSITTGGSDNITIPGGYINTTLAQIQSVHANATITPRFVDTSVPNQTFVYEIKPTGVEAISNITINLPAGYALRWLESIERAGSNDTSLSANSTNSSIINITINTPTTNTVRVYFKANTSANPVNSSAFSSIITGSNLTNVAADPSNLTVNVTTRQLINVTNVNAIKTSALINGTDYWDFNFTLNITATTSGLIHFRMDAWNNTAGQTISLTNQTEISSSTFYYATFRQNDANMMNVTTYYNYTRGISLSATENTLYYMALRMVIPSGTPVSSSWWTTYSLLFRSSP